MAFSLSLPIIQCASPLIQPFIPLPAGASSIRATVSAAACLRALRLARRPACGERMFTARSAARLRQGDLAPRWRHRATPAARRTRRKHIPHLEEQWPSHPSPCLSAVLRKTLLFGATRHAGVDARPTVPNPRCLGAAGVGTAFPPPKQPACFSR
ncbi:hypothetical protein AAFF_G00217890 [Aldrovandia affinis]|uniref:Uncharacterized protein n=1 Tax=Aldrovandia affinis TaxID=143900 RepID=A0AAD7SW21_9TELE|nr:hypothetical protein AAFF_G00217890 [Aldrovandia affinis]